MSKRLWSQRSLKWGSTSGTWISLQKYRGLGREAACIGCLQVIWTLLFDMDWVDMNGPKHCEICRIGTAETLEIVSEYRSYWKQEMLCPAIHKPMPCHAKSLKLERLLLDPALSAKSKWRAMKGWRWMLEILVRVILLLACGLIWPFTSESWLGGAVRISSHFLCHVVYVVCIL